MPNTLHFFTDIDLIQTQPLGGAFGPYVSSLTPDEYRITSLHSSSSDANAYAILDGVVCVQPVNGSSDLVNLILKPLDRLQNELPVVEYFIYKGIKFNSLFDGNFIQLSGNDLVNSINDFQNSLNASIDELNGDPIGTTTDRPSQKTLGYHLNNTIFPDSAFIEELFFRSDLEVQFPIVRAGDSLGLFDASSFGLDIIAPGVGYFPKLDLCRNIQNSIVVPDLGVSPSNADIFRHWNSKEQILNFIDPAAFFGSFYTHKILAKTSTGNFEKKSKNEIYDEVLVTFFNKDKVYVDIRNEHNFSFNYYGNYGNDIGLSFNDSTVATTNYYQLGWPILIIDSSMFPTGNTQNKNVLHLTLSVGDNNDGLLFVNAGILNRGKGYVRLPKATKGKRRFIDLVSDDDVFFRTIDVAIPNNSGVGVTTLVSSYIKLTIVKKLSNPENIPNSFGTVLRSKYHLDHVFTISQEDVISFTSNSLISSKVFQDDFYIDSRASNGAFYFAKTGIAIDTNNLTLFSFASVMKKSSNKISICSEISDEASNYLNLIDSKLPYSEIVSRLTTFSSGPLTQLLSSQMLESGFLNYSDAIQVEELNAIVIGLSDFASIQTLAANSFDQEFKIFLALDNKNLATDLDDEGIPFTRFDLVLRGFVEVSGNIEIQDVNTNLKIYSNDVI